MKNYIIDENTVAVLKSNHKTIIFDVENIRVINKSINKVLEDNCLLNGSSVMGRKNSAEKLLNIKYKIPIYINKNIILIQLNSLRDNSCLFIVLNKILNFKYINDLLNIMCVDNYIFSCKISENCFENLIVNGVKLNNILKYQNI